ncbi:hypothetical protein ACFT7S_14640 [Streptomyces sp. NPDC057136]|uniref:hypothetical protein n=1 Tax=Streptomyces sp. NPDC057136 TaxID=3346029 RepID=UPI0036329257
MDLPLVGLSAAVLFTVLLPLAASAVTSGAPESVLSDAKSGVSLLSDGLSAEHGAEHAQNTVQNTAENMPENAAEKCPKSVRRIALRTA